MDKGLDIFSPLSFCSAKILLSKFFPGCAFFHGMVYKTMYFTRIVSFLSFFFITYSACADMFEGRNITCEVFLYHEGSVEKVTENGDKIIAEMENIFLNSDDTYRLIVSKELLANIKNGEAVEIVYSRAKIFKSAFLRKEIEISKLFIPLKGKFTTSYITIFFDNPDYGSFNVLVNKNGFSVLDRLKGLVK